MIAESHALHTFRVWYTYKSDNQTFSRLVKAECKQDIDGELERDLKDEASDFEAEYYPEEFTIDKVDNICLCGCQSRSTPGTK